MWTHWTSVWCMPWWEGTEYYGMPVWYSECYTAKHLCNSNVRVLFSWNFHLIILNQACLLKSKTIVCVVSYNEGPLQRGEILTREQEKQNWWAGAWHRPAFASVTAKVHMRAFSSSYMSYESQVSLLPHVPLVYEPHWSKFHKESWLPFCKMKWVAPPRWWHWMWKCPGEHNTLELNLLHQIWGLL